MDIVHSGVTRHVVLTKRYAIKVVRWRGSMGLARAYLANQSEWRQRRDPYVNGPVFTLLHLATWFPRADAVGDWEPEDAPDGRRTVAMRRSNPYGWRTDLNDVPQCYEETKGSSWGVFGLHTPAAQWLLIDFDRAWAEPRRGIVCRLYYWNQERLGRKWSKL